MTDKIKRATDGAQRKRYQELCLRCGIGENQPFQNDNCVGEFFNNQISQNLADFYKKEPRKSKRDFMNYAAHSQGSVLNPCMNRNDMLAMKKACEKDFADNTASGKPAKPVPVFEEIFDSDAYYLAIKQRGEIESDFIACFKYALLAKEGVLDAPNAARIDKAYELAWQYGHSEGLIEVEVHFEGFVDLVGPSTNIGKDDIKPETVHSESIPAMR